MEKAGVWGSARQTLALAHPNHDDGGIRPPTPSSQAHAGRGFQIYLALPYSNSTMARGGLPLALVGKYSSSLYMSVVVLSCSTLGRFQNI